MHKNNVSHVGSPYRQEHEQRSEVMLTTPPTTSRQLPRLSYLNATAGTVISSVNGTLVVHVTADTYNYQNIREENTTNDSNNINNNTTTVSYEQLSRQFYESYDPSVGLHTAAVLGGILVWLVLYVIYRTKIRKCVLRLIKKQFGAEEDLDPKFSDSDIDSSSGVNPTMVRALINPSIVIEASPPQSPLTYEQYSRSGEQECFSPFSVQGAGESEHGVFHFPYTSLDETQEYINSYKQQPCTEQRETFLQLPRSEIDIPTATAQWVQNTPLETRSHQDFTGLMLAMKNQGLLAMNKHCSCPLVCPTSPQPLPLLDMPSSWNMSLPVLSSSLSSQMLSAYDTVTNNHASDKNIKDLINAKRKMNKKKDKCGNNQIGDSEKNFLDKFYSNRRQSHAGVSNNISKIHLKMPPNLKIKTVDAKENHPLLGSSTFTRSPVPIPFTPTVMIQTSKPTHKRLQDCESNDSFSSSSSMDMLLAPTQAPPIHIKPGSPKIPSPHLLTPTYEARRESEIPNVFSWSRDDINRYHEETAISGSSNPLPCSARHQPCSFKYQRTHPKDKDFHTQSNDRIFRRHGSCVDSTCETRYSGLSHQHRSLSDYNYHDDFLFSSPFPSTQPHNRSLSTDVPVSVKLPAEEESPTFCIEGNKDSTRSFSYSPTPYLLQVPDPSNVNRAMVPDYGGSNKCHIGTYNTGNHPPMRHCVHSDSNIAYYNDQCFLTDSNVDNFPVRRHSAFVPGEINLSFCDDNTVRPSSSFGSTGSYNSPHHHPQLPHRHSSHHQDHDHHDHHYHHHSTGMLGLDDSNAQHNISCISHPHSNMNRSFSAVVMETKL